MVNTPTTRDGTWDPILDKRTGKPKRISKRLQDAVRLIESGEVRSIKAAAGRTGLSYAYLVEALHKPATEAFIAKIKRRNLSAAALRGSQRALELVDSPSERTSIEATKLVLGIDGFHADTAPRVDVRVDVRAGYVIDLSGGSPSATVIEGCADVSEHPTPTRTSRLLDSDPLSGE
jgi:hypothetical protein